MTGKVLCHTETKMVCNPLEFEGIDYICQKLSIMVILDKPITREELVRLAENEEIRARIRSIVNKYMA